MPSNRPFKKTRWMLERLGNHYIQEAEVAAAIQCPLGNIGNGSAPVCGSKPPRIVEMPHDLMRYHRAIRSITESDSRLKAVFYVKYMAPSVRKHGKTTDHDRAKALKMSYGLFQKSLDRLLVSVQAIVEFIED